MLIAYQSTPNPATGVILYNAMRGAVAKIRLHFVEPQTQNTEEDETFNLKDVEYKLSI